MKAVFSLSVFLLFVPTGFAQTPHNKTLNRQVIGEITNSGSFIARLYSNILEKDTIYTLVFRNAFNSSVVDIQSVNFLNEKDDLGQLYNHLKSVFNNHNRKDKNYRQQFSLGGLKVTASNYRFMGTTSVLLSMPPGNLVLSEKDLDHLFGRNESP